jgi:hypothetical protein
MNFPLKNIKTTISEMLKVESHKFNHKDLKKNFKGIKRYWLGNNMYPIGLISLDGPNWTFRFCCAWKYPAEDSSRKEKKIYLNSRLKVRINFSRFLMLKIFLRFGQLNLNEACM